jgi:hypothetical protein
LQLANTALRKFRFPEAIPPLRGIAAAAYLALWLALLVVFFIGTVGVVADRLHTGVASVYTWNPLGFQTDANDGKPYRIVAPITATARGEGIREGDLILKVGGIDTASRPGDNDQTSLKIRNRLLVDEGVPVHLLVKSSGEAPREMTVLHLAANAREMLAPVGLTATGLTYANIALFVLPALILLAGAALLVGRRREPVAAVLSLSFLALGSMAGNQGAFWDERGLFGLLVVCDTLGFSGLYLGLVSFPDGRFTPRWTAVLPLLALISLLPTLLLDWPSWPIGVWLLAAIGVMALRYHMEAADQRRQWKWALIGFAGGIATFLATGIIYDAWYLAGHKTELGPVLWSWIITPLLLALIYALIVGGIVLSVLRYRLYDTSAAISRSLVYSVLTLTLVAIFAGSEKIIEIAGEEAFGEEAHAYAGGLAAAFAATTIAPLHHRISHWAEHLLRKDLLHLRRDLPARLFEFGETAEESTVAEALLEHIVHGLHASCAAVLYSGEALALRGAEPEALALWQTTQGANRPDKLGVDKHDPLFPVRLPLNLRATGWLLLGPRPDGSLYGRDEMDLLTDLALPAAQALGAARRNSAQTQRIDALAKEFAALREMLVRRSEADTGVGAN